MAQSAMPTEIFFVRHGTTRANLENRFAGRSAEPLHATGVEQMLHLGTGLQTVGISRIYSAPLPRTQESARILSQSLGGLPVITEPDLNEIDIPHWDGLGKDEIRQRFGPEYPAWLDDPAGFQVAGCETLAQVQQRALAAVARITAAAPGEKVLAVSHLIVGRCLALHFQNQPLAHFRRIKIDNGSATRFVVRADRSLQPVSI